MTRGEGLGTMIEANIIKKSNGMNPKEEAIAITIPLQTTDSHRIGSHLEGGVGLVGGRTTGLGMIRRTPDEMHLSGRGRNCSRGRRRHRHVLCTMIQLNLRKLCNYCINHVVGLRSNYKY